MFPWVYEFHWTPFHIGFLLVFFTVFAVITSTLVKAFLRTRSDEQQDKFEAIQWHSDFGDLSPRARACRHELTGDVNKRTCDNEFNCRDCKVHPVLTAHRQSSSISHLFEFEVLGFTMPPYRMYHRGHTWVQEEHDGTYKVGIDDFGDRLIGTPDHIDLPPVGTQLKVNGTGWRVKKGKATLRILSPIEGEVIEHGNVEDGWYLKVKADETKDVTSHLLKAHEIRPWITREMERLQISFATSGIGPTLADGGELVPGFHRFFPKADWDGVLGQMFLEA